MWTKGIIERGVIHLNILYNYRVLGRALNLISHRLILVLQIITTDTMPHHPVTETT